ncbi:MAG TPA: EAL domain-containing protein [Rhodanobacteraceae bacterium]|nr:EAL domain-containing protein [Rhodanobacteraceae bacterium]
MDAGRGLELMLYLAQAGCAIAQASIFAYYYRVSRLEHLRLWGLSFVALALYLVAALLSSNMGDSPLGSLPLRMGISGASLTAAYLQIALLALGTMAVLGRHPPSRRFMWGLLGISVLLGIATMLLFAGPPSASTQRILVRSGLRYALTGAAYLIVAILLWRRARRSGLGARVAAFAIGAYGVQLLHALAILIAEAEFGVHVQWAPYIGVLDLIAQLFIGYGLVVWLLEDERLRYERADNALRRLRDFDPVTGFPNRRRLLSDLEAMLRGTNQRTAAMLVRVDQADMLTSSLGMVAAEAVMAQAASRVEECALPGWPRPARLSESRLVQIVPHVHATGDLAATADNLLAMLRAPFYSGSRELALSASIGIALSPGDATQAAPLIAAAEAAAQLARDEGGNRFHFYSTEMNSLVLTRLGLQAELRRALLRGEFELYFQPLLGARSHRLAGAEALVRWRHPKRGLIAPDMFIDEMERLGMIEDLDRHVLERACRDAQQWRVHDGKPLTVAVNISTRSFQREHLPDLVRAVLASTGLDPKRLELEVVESSALDDIDRATECLTRLRALGVRVSLDDFGTGYSSLSHLRALPVDCLKIDRSFGNEVLVDPRTAAIVAAIVTLAHSLGLEVTVEGVENAAQQAWFEQHGVDRLQGYHFARPMDAERWRALQNEQDSISVAGGA